LRAKSNESCVEECYAKWGVGKDGLYIGYCSGREFDRGFKWDAGCEEKVCRKQRMSSERLY
jgi:hypothetical protein